MNIHAMNNEELDHLAWQNEQRKRSAFKFETMGQVIANMEDYGKQPLIKGILNLKETSAWIAPPGGMKSALLASAAVHLATGRDWHGYRVKNCVGVVYFALERADLVRRRLVAQATRMGINPKTLNVIVVSEMIDLMNPATVEKIVDFIKIAGNHLTPPENWDDIPEEEDNYSSYIGLIIFDTFAKLIAAGGGDEDKAKDQGKLFANLQRIKNETEAHIALIGHTGKDETRGSRGSNAIVGDVDVMVTISGGETKTATVIKANDAPEGPLFSFRSETYEFGVDEDGDPITVNIVSGEDLSVQLAPKPQEPRLTANQKTGLPSCMAPATTVSFLKTGIPRRERQASARAGKPTSPTQGTRCSAKASSATTASVGQWCIRECRGMDQNN